MISLRVWGKIKVEDSIISETTLKAKSLEDAVDLLCAFFDLSKPIICKKHFSEIDSFSRTVFYADDFVERVSFDCLELEIIDDAK